MYIFLVRILEMIKNLPRIWLSTCGRTWGQRTKKSIDWNQRERKRDWKDVAKEKAAMETERTSSRLYMWASTTIHYIDIYKHNKQLGIPRWDFLLLLLLFLFFPTSFTSFYLIPNRQFRDPILSELSMTNQQTKLSSLWRGRERFAFLTILWLLYSVLVLSKQLPLVIAKANPQQIPFS